MMKFNLQKYAEMLSILQLVGADHASFAEALMGTYLVTHEEKESILEAMNDMIFRSTNTIERLHFLEGCILKGADCFGKTQFEKELLTARRSALTILAKNYGNEWETALHASHDSTLGHCLSGLSFYYGMDREENKKLGQDFLVQAAEQECPGNEHAILCLFAIDKRIGIPILEKSHYSFGHPLPLFIEEAYKIKTQQNTSLPQKKRVIGFY